MIADTVAVYLAFLVVAGLLWPVARGLRWLSETPIEQRREWLARADRAVGRALNRQKGRTK